MQSQIYDLFRRMSTDASDNKTSSLLIGLVIKAPFAFTLQIIQIHLFGLLNYSTVLSPGT